MRTNESLQKDVMDAIKWEPLLNAAEIGVTAIDGIITLTGTVDSYAKKLEAESAAKKIAGVKVVVEKIEIKIGTSFKRDDNEIANEIIAAYKWNWEVPIDKVKVRVENGWVTLEGTFEWNYQKDAAKKAVKNLDGITGVSNNIKIKSEMFDNIEKGDIERALVRNWSLNDANIQVGVSDDKVTLNGTVHSFYQRDEAERIAWNTRSVNNVDNNLIIKYDF